MFRRQPRVFRAEDDIFEWFTVSYASIAGVVAGLLMLVGYFYPRDRPASTQPPTSTHARFNWFDGVVKVKAAGAPEWVMASAELVLGGHDLVRTLPGAVAEIAFFDGTLVLIRPDSLVSIEESSEDPVTRRRRVAWHIASGEVQFKTGPRTAPRSSSEVATPTIRGSVGGSSSAAVRVAESGASEFRLFEGTGQVTTKTGQRMALGAAQALRVTADGKMGPTLTLPSPPVLAPIQREAVVSRDSGARARLTWQPEPSAVAYRVMVDHSAAFAWPLVDRKDIKENAIELRGLDPGRYFWRVAALSGDDLEGAFSEYSRLEVVRTRSAAGARSAPLRVDSVEVRGRIAQVKGRTEPFARLTINGQRAEVQADGAFNEFINLLPLTNQEIVIQVQGANGGVAEQRRSVTLPVS